MHYASGDGWCVGKSKLSSRQSTIAKVFCSRQSIYLLNDIVANLAKNKMAPLHEFPKKKHIQSNFKKSCLTTRICCLSYPFVEGNHFFIFFPRYAFDDHTAQVPDRIFASEWTRHDANERCHCCNRTWVVGSHIPRCGPEGRRPVT